MPGPKRSWSDDQLIVAVATSNTRAQVLRKIGLIPAGGSYKFVGEVIESLGLDTSHFVGQAWAAGTSGHRLHEKPLEEVLVAGRRCNSSQLKKRLVRLGLLEDRCYNQPCKVTVEWLGAPISLHLDHINGDHADNRLENLRILCPNCHSQTETYCRKKSKLNKPA